MRTFERISLPITKRHPPARPEQFSLTSNTSLSVFQNSTPQSSNYLIFIYISNFEQVLAATPHKSPTIRPPTTRHGNYPSCWRSRDEFISDVLLWTPTYGRAKAGQPARTYTLQLCEDTGWSPEDLPEAMNERESSERGSWISVQVAQHDDDDDDVFSKVVLRC